MKYLYFILIILCCVVNAHAENWKLFHSNSEFYDEDSIVKAGGKIALWIRSDYEPAQYDRGERVNINYAKYYVELDCSMRMITVNGSFYYDAQGTLLKRDLPKASSRIMVPIIFNQQTKGQALYESLCVKINNELPPSQ